MADVNHNNCAHGEQTISYLYGEIDARSKAAFEEHSKNCSTCADEMAGFGSVRSSILQWKSEEFQLLNTPKIEFQNAPPESANNIDVSPIKTDSWIDRLRNLFIPSPFWAASFIFFIVLGGLLLFVYNFSNNNQNNQIVKGNTGDSQIPNSSSINLNKEAEIAGKTIPDDTKRISEDELPEVEKPANKNIIAKDSESNKTNIRVASAAKSEQITVSKTYSEVSRRNISASAGKSKNLNTVAAAKIPARKLRIPQIEQIEDGEDDATLRLTDLFDEVGDK
ncbi:MAG TPA: hypothetical protein VNI84_04265 [Pyrinomonadaceae bacterium]|nr:hypothetical protein [Pyrinomonadaceae bacterium]